VGETASKAWPSSNEGDLRLGDDSLSFAFLRPMTLEKNEGMEIKDEGVVCCQPRLAKGRESLSDDGFAANGIDAPTRAVTPSPKRTPSSLSPS
jgi:hypothetical protein